MAELVIGPIGFPKSTTPGQAPTPSSGMKPGGIAINLADRIIWTMGYDGVMFPLVGSDPQGVINAHMNENNPHDTWDVESLVDLGDLTVTNSSGFYEYRVRRIGAGDASILLEDDCVIGTELHVDNVRATSGTVTITSESGLIQLEGATDSQTVTLTGKGQVSLVKSGSAADGGADNWEVVHLVN